MPQGSLRFPAFVIALAALSLVLVVLSLINQARRPVPLGQKVITTLEHDGARLRPCPAVVEYVPREWNSFPLRIGTENLRVARNIKGIVYEAKLPPDAPAVVDPSLVHEDIVLRVNTHFRQLSRYAESIVIAEPQGPGSLYISAPNYDIMRLTGATEWQLEPAPVARAMARHIGEARALAVTDAASRRLRALPPGQVLTRALAADVAVLQRTDDAASVAEQALLLLSRPPMSVVTRWPNGRAFAWAATADLTIVKIYGVHRGVPWEATLTAKPPLPPHILEPILGGLVPEAP